MILDIHQKGEMEENDIVALSVEDDDKKFASEAVKFVIGHTRNGFVPLCASVATLLKDKASLEKENDNLRKEIIELRQSLSANDVPKEKLSYISLGNDELDCYGTSKLIRDVDQIKSFKYKRKDYSKIYRPIIGCLCNTCCKELMLNEGLIPPLQKGDRTIVSGEICGSVVYIGHIDAFDFPEIFIGLHLDEPVGDCNGKINGKTYFEVPKEYGLIVSLFNVCCLLN